MKMSIQKIILITLLSFLFIREIIPFQFSYYKLNSSSQTTYQSNCTSTEHNGLSSITYHEIDLDKIDGIDIIFDGLGDDRNDYIRGQDIIVEVTTPKLNNWRYYTPLYKNISISNNFDYSFRIKLKRNNQAKEVSCRGAVDIASSHTILGICSGRKTKELVQNKVYLEIKKQIQSEIQEKIDIME